VGAAVGRVHRPGHGHATVTPADCSR
jgi:hypothetical protein